MKEFKMYVKDDDDIVKVLDYASRLKLSNVKDKSFYKGSHFLFINEVGWISKDYNFNYFKGKNQLHRKEISVAEFLNMTIEDFQDDKDFHKNFDLVEFDQVLVRDSIGDPWDIDQFSYIDYEGEFPFIGMNTQWKYIVKYDPLTMRGYAGKHTDIIPGSFKSEDVVK